MNKKGRFLILLTALLLVPVAGAFAEDLSNDEIQAAFDAIWLIVAGALVFFMQAGFAMVETGLTRAKNAGNIIMKNLLDFSVGAIMYWAIGWALMYGESIGGFLGWSDFAVHRRHKSDEGLVLPGRLRRNRRHDRVRCHG